MPLDGARITDDTRIRASLPTIRYLREHGAEVIVCSHLGRPKGEVRPELSLRPVADRLAELLGEPVAFDGEAGPVRLLENLRFDPREEKNDPALAAELASLADLFVSDAFGTVHRAHASTVGVAHLLPSAAGLLLAAELEAFARILENPEHPFVVVIGGAKVADKIGVIDRFTGLADAVLVGGAMAFTFLAARGVAVGASKHEDADGQEVARRAMADAGERGCELVLPSDVVIAERVEADAPTAGRRRRRHPRRLDGSRHRPRDGGRVCAPAGGRPHDLLERARWACSSWRPSRAGTLAVAHAAADVGRRLGGRRRRLGRGRQPGRGRRSHHPRVDRRRRRARAGRRAHASRRGSARGGGGMSRRPFVAGNWKMHKTAAEAADFVARLAAHVPASVDVAVCPTYTALAEAAGAASGLRIAVYAQNMHQAASGAFTGEISAEMILDTGADGVLLGHSERRQLFGETDEGVNAKLAAAHDAGLWVIVAVGETEAEREAGETERVLRRQVEGALRGIGAERVAETTIAYEPVWAIGTGRTATPRWRRRRTPRSARSWPSCTATTWPRPSGSSTAAR